MRLDIPDHLQADFKALIQYGNEARDHYGKEVKRSVRFFEEELGLILHLGLPSGKWVKPSEAREIGKYRRQHSLSSMRRALDSKRDLDDSMVDEAAFKAFTMTDSPLTGSNTVPITSTPTRAPANNSVEPDEEMPETSGNFQ